MKQFQSYGNSRYADAQKTHRHLYKIVMEDQLADVFPNIEIVLRIFLTLMITNCSAERSFSQLKRIKAAERATTRQERLEVLGVLCIESDLLNKIDIDDQFADKNVENDIFKIVDLGQETGVLAISLMANRRLHVIERIIWCLIVSSAINAAYHLGGMQLHRFLNSPTVISVDRDYRGWHGPLPAVTLCYYDHIDAFKANDYIRDNWNVTVMDDDYFYFMDFLSAVVNATVKNYAHLARFAQDERFDEVNFTDVVHSINRPFNQVLTSSDKDNSTIQINPVMTERGYCYAINSPMSKLMAGSNIEYNDIVQPLTCEYDKEKCFIKMDLYESTGTVDVHSPFEVSASDANLIYLRKSDEITASFKVLETVASINLRNLEVGQRRCVFYDEETSQLKVYSKTLCLVRCRAVMAMEMCNCVPFFYGFVEGPSCDPVGFECLLDFKWPIWALHICKCPSTCTEVEYTVQTAQKSFWGVKSEDLGNTNDGVISSFRWDVIPPKVRMRRDVVFSYEDLLVSFGGTLALFLGFSQITLVRGGYVLIYHMIMGFVEMFVSLRNYCQCNISFFKRKSNSNPGSLCLKKTNNRVALLKKRQKLIAVHSKL
ncbi:pickpocket protein 19 [Eurosta solidaginis]|uniref:pickpocket protein 19 n=1 Tax=Eurosta solidaginis TaxID=178769 RepID=UPI0035310BAB